MSTISDTELKRLIIGSHSEKKKAYDLKRHANYSPGAFSSVDYRTSNQDLSFQGIYLLFVTQLNSQKPHLGGILELDNQADFVFG